MLFLPKANPLYENIAATKIAVPAVLEKLGKEGLTGYLDYCVPGFEAHCIFATGKLICAVSSEGDRAKTGFEALVQLFDKVITAGGEINIYRMTLDLVAGSYALAVGTRMFDGDEIRQIDIKSVLARLKMQGLTGAVRFYTPDRFAVIFYKEGSPVGFFHDGSTTIESSPEESRKVAALPGARVTVCSAKPIDELMRYDLLQMVNLGKLWEAAITRRAAQSPKEDNVVAVVLSVPDNAILAGLVDDLAEVASAYLSRSGRELVERLIKEGGGSSLVADKVLFTRFLQQIETEGRAIDSDARMEEMIDLMKTEVSGRLAR